MTSGSFRLIERTGPNPGMTFELNKEISLIGRDVSTDIVINDPEVSRQHARLTRTPGGYVLEDLGSTNGSFVNGERLVAPRVLSPGDLIGLGENVTVTFDAESAESAATVLSAASGYEPPPAQPQSAPPPSPAMPEPAVPMAQEGGDDRRRWIYAGCGCLVLLSLCVGVFWFMDAYYPDILYAPLRIFGF